MKTLGAFDVNGALYEFIFFETAKSAIAVLPPPNSVGAGSRIAEVQASSGAEAIERLTATIGALQPK